MAGGNVATAPGPAELGQAGGTGGSTPWRDLRPRVLSALIMLPLAIGAVWAGGVAWAVALALVVALVGWEWTRLTGFTPRALPGWLMQLGALGGTLLAALGAAAAGLGLAAVAAGLALAVLPRRAGASPPGWLAFGILYIGLAGIALAALRALPGAGLGNILFLLLVVWASDIGAYLVGRLAGGPKLAPAISPGKTWSGALGGLLAALAVGLAFAPGAPGRALVVAALLGLVSQLGDLFESWVKRRFRVKDSSALIPGHGGLLDRVDGVLAAAPVAAALAIRLDQGGFLWR